MARYNKIFAGPATQNTPQVVEAIAADDTLPGCLMVLTAGEFALADTTTVGKVFIAQDNYLAMKGVDDVWEEDSTMIGMEMLDEQFFNARVATGNNLAKGSPLMPGANGTLVLATGFDKMVVAHSEEAYNNNTGATQLVRVRAARGYMTPTDAT